MGSTLSLGCCRRRCEKQQEGKEGDTVVPAAHPPPHGNAHADDGGGALQADVAMASDGQQGPPSFCGVQPLSEPRPRCLIDSLADVELQLVMQFLDTRGKLSAAKCSRRLLHAARHPFAWKDAQLVVVSISQLASAPSASSLLRLIPLSLRLDSADPPCDVGRLMELFPAAACVREMYVMEPRWVREPWQQLLSAPALQSLQQFSASCCHELPAESLQLLARMPQLQSLSLLLSRKSDLGPLGAAPHLTHLTLHLHMGEMPVAHSIGQCLQLRSLRLVGWTAGLSQLFALPPSLQQRLERLELDGFLALPHPHHPWTVVPTAEEICDGLAAMQHLTELRLKGIHPVDALLACLHAAPALRLLDLYLSPQHPDTLDTDIDASGVTQPTLAVVRSLLTRAPQLRVRMVLPPSIWEWLPAGLFLDLLGGDSFYLQAEYAHQWHYLRRDWAACEEPRVAVVTVPVGSPYPSKSR